MSQPNMQTIDININGRYLEGIALEVITPGYLLQRASHEPDKVEPHMIIDAPSAVLVAQENQIAGTDIFTDYQIGDTVYMRSCLRGDVFLGHAVAPVSPGNYVASAGNGRLVPWIAPSWPVGVVLGLGATADHILVEVF